MPVVLPFAEPYELHHRDIALNLVHLDRDFVRAIAGDDDFAFDTMRRPTSEGAALWQSVVRRHSSTWLDVERPMSPIEQRDIAEAFATAAIRAFPAATAGAPRCPAAVPSTSGCAVPWSSCTSTPASRSARRRSRVPRD